jgi:hypothetical protein
MAIRTPAELRDSAKRFREMAREGGDVRLQAALLLIANEFETEAASAQTVEVAAEGTRAQSAATPH